MERKDQEEKKAPTIANGIDNDEELEADATEAEIKRGDYTKVTKLIWDEYDPSGK
ncbi:MAG: hypothetical protein ACO1OC_05025 [Tuberibacillus sp.]